MKGDRSADYGSSEVSICLERFYERRNGRRDGIPLVAKGGVIPYMAVH